MLLRHISVYIGDKHTDESLFFCFTLCVIIISPGTFNLSVAATQPSGGNGTYFCGVIDDRLDKQHSDQYPNRHYARTAAANLNVGEPRTVRMIYFLPKGQTFRANIVQKMKDEIRNIQTFYAKQMGAHGYGNTTFHVETDPQGEPIVHRIDGHGQHPDSDYFNHAESAVLYEIEQMFNLIENIYFIFIDIGEIRRTRGVGRRQGKNGGYAFVTGEFRWHVVAHELGHAFGLRHDFSSDDVYIMSSGSEPSQLSVCHAEFLSMHSYFNPNTPIEVGQRPTIELISPRTYPVGSKSVSVRLKISDSEDLHQVFLHVQTREPHKAAGSLEVKTCRGLGGQKDAVVEFEYDGVIPSDSLTSLSTPIVHPIFVEAVDADGNMSRINFVLFSETLQPLMKISGDNQTGLPNTPLPLPFVIEVRDLKDGFARSGISITFAVATGSGILSTTRTTTDQNGRAESTLTLGSNLGINTVSASAAGIEQTVNFNAVAGNAVDIPDPNLRTVTETTLGKAEGKPIAPTEMTTLTRLEAPEAGISNLSGLEGATNLRGLNLWRNSVSNLSPLAGLTKLTELYLGINSAPDLSPLAGLTNLESLFLDRNGISDLSALAGLTLLTRLALNNNSISDLSPLVELINLRWMRLASNNISDLSPLVANTGLGSGDEVNVRGNPLNYASIYTHIPDLQNRGVTVEFDTRKVQRLLKTSGDNQQGTIGAVLTDPFVVEVRDRNGAVFAGVPVTFAVTAGGGTLSVTSTTTDENGRAQSTLTLGPNLGTNIVEVSAAGIEVPATFHALSDTEAPLIAADVNSDGLVNILDLVLVSSRFGQSGQNNADVNGDGIVNILDLVLVAGMFDGAAAAPAAQPQIPETLTAVEVQGWLTDARALEVRDPIMKRGFVVLEHLLVSLTPKETELLPNYPNPFNPETWIPYRLAEDAFVTLTIYGGSGQAVRTLEVGHRIASAYEDRSKAIYWDGRNDIGERVASDVYFYTLIAGEYSATRKMLILK